MFEGKCPGLRNVLIGVVVTTCFHLTDCEDSFFVSVIYDKFQNLESYACVTNSSFALSWNGPYRGDTSDLVSRYIPQTERSPFDCEITNDFRTTTIFSTPPWSLTSSLETILDRRWENFEVIKTKSQKKDGSTETYEKIPLQLQHDFNVSLSIRTYAEAHVFLCDGDSPPTSNCYWFMLQGWDGKRSAIRKCKESEIPNKKGVRAKAPCNVNLKEIEHPRSEKYKLRTTTSKPDYLSNTAWLHLKIMKQGNIVSVVQTFANKSEDTILEWTDDQSRGKAIDVSQMFVHSKMVDARWKIHQIDYIYTTEDRNRIPFGPRINAVADSICVSMFVKMCKSCSLKLTLLDQKDTLVKEETFRPEHLGWSEIKFIVESVRRNDYSVAVSTIGSSSDRFWAIDKVRQCQKTEFRLISVDDTRPLPYVVFQLMSGTRNVAFLDGPIPFSTIPVKTCPENTIGEFCVPCNWIYSECKRILICSKNEKENTKCFCSAGYQYKNDCKDECTGGYYGHGCGNKCATGCSEYCNTFNGTCHSCIENYAGPKCDKSAAFFAEAPTIEDIRCTQVTVSIVNFTLRVGTITDKPSTYTIQYKEANALEQKWMNYSLNVKFNETRDIIISDLKADTTYLVRGVITMTSYETYVDDHIPTVQFTTECEEPTEINIGISGGSSG